MDESEPSLVRKQLSKLNIVGNYWLELEKFKNTMKIK